MVESNQSIKKSKQELDMKNFGSLIHIGIEDSEGEVRLYEFFPDETTSDLYNKVSAETGFKTNEF